MLCYGSAFKIHCDVLLVDCASSFSKSIDIFIVLLFFPNLNYMFIQSFPNQLTFCKCDALFFQTVAEKKMSAGG
jgi:hypothetical protein